MADREINIGRPGQSDATLLDEIIGAASVHDGAWTWLTLDGKRVAAIVPPDAAERGRWPQLKIEDGQVSVVEHNPDMIGGEGLEPHRALRTRIEGLPLDPMPFREWPVTYSHTEYPVHGPPVLVFRYADRADPLKARSAGPAARTEMERYANQARQRVNDELAPFTVARLARVAGQLIRKGILSPADLGLPLDWQQDESVEDGIERWLRG